MSDVWHAVGARVGRQRRRWARGVRRSITGLLWLAGSGLLATGADRGAEGGHVLMAGSVPVFFVAMSWQVWRAPEHHLPDALRLRRRSRRVGLRLGWLCLLGASAGLVSSAYRSWRGTDLAHLPGGVGLWLLALAPVPVLVESALWLLAPRDLRREVGVGRNAEEVQRVNLRYHPPKQLGFDPGSGACGLPVPAFAAAGGTAGRSCRITPSRALLVSPTETMTDAEERWLHNAGLAWNGTELIVTDGRGRQTRGSSLADRPVELVRLGERDRLMAVTEWSVLLLDDQGRRLLTLPGLGWSHPDLRRLASAAGLRYSVHQLPKPAWEWGIPLTSRLFPRRRGHIRIRIR
jgi:hypothetical protein